MLTVPARQLPPLLHSSLMLLGVGIIYWWLHIPHLQFYSIQLFAVLGLIYFILKKISQAKHWHFLPATMSLETIVATACLLLLIGATGGTFSWFFPLIYLALFMVVFSSDIGNSIFTALLMMLFLYGTSAQLHQHELVAMLSLPIVALFLIFAKKQHSEVIQDQFIIHQEIDQISELETVATQETQLENFLNNFLSPRIQQIEKLVAYPSNFHLIQTQLHLIKLEVEKILTRLEDEK